MHFYRNGNYTVGIMEDGTKIRKNDLDYFDPDFAENVDVCITKKCSQNCKFCYEGCNINGKHGNILSYKFLDTLHPYTELALNGNDMDHPQLIQFLNKLKERKVFANMTVNQNQFMNNIELIKRLIEDKLIYGIGISYSHYNEWFLNEVKKLNNAVLHTINGIITLNDLEKLKGKNLKILILGYKNIRRGSDYLESNHKEVTDNQQDLYDNLETIVKENWFKVVSFDNLAITQLNVKRLMSQEEWESFYMGDDGNFTFYIDMVNGEFSKNSCEIEKRYKIDNLSIDDMFNKIKERK